MNRRDDPFCMGSHKWPGAGKVIEETSELNVNLAKLIVNGGKPHYWGGINLTLEIEDEIADTIAAINFFVKENNLDVDRINERAGIKEDRFDYWRETTQ